MSFHSLPFEPRQIRATEDRLERLYQASRMGLKGDSLALAAGLLPVEYRRLNEFDPAVEIAVTKGRADSEFEAATTINNAIRAGDAKVALDFLKHRHDWVAKQSIEVSVDERISVIGALERAERRAIAFCEPDIVEAEFEDTQHAASEV